MADDWKPGDLALCVRDGFNTRAGQTFTVIAVLPPRLFGPVPALGLLGGTMIALLFREVLHPSNEGGIFAPTRFRKIRPLTDEEREQFVTELNTPAKERVS